MISIREATLDDAAACAAIYAHYVKNTAITFEIEPPDEIEMAGRIESALVTHTWLVATCAGRVVGYSYAHSLNSRPAYNWSCEVSIYLEAGRRRSGTGRALYTELFPRLAGRGYRMAVAGMTLPNDASVGLHRAMGFEQIGVWKKIGWKHGTWHDVAFAQLPIGGDQDAPSPITGQVNRVP